MTVTVKNIIPTKTVENTTTKQYTSTNLVTIIDKFTATNYSAVAATISVYLVDADTLPANNNVVVYIKSIPAGQTYTFPELVGQVLNVNAYISTLCSAASAMTIRASGRQIT
jgi:hypothetical protein